MDRDYLQDALHSFNINIPNWYAWKKHDENGNKIPNNQRMCYECVISIKDGAIVPTKAEVNAKIEELKQADADKETKKASGKQKLLDLGLTEEEVKALIGV